MKYTLALLVAVLAVAYAQYPTTVTPLSNGVEYTGSFAGSETYSERVFQVFSFWVSENASSVVLSFADTTVPTTGSSSCDFYLYVDSTHVPIYLDSTGDINYPAEQYSLSNNIYYGASEDWEVYPDTSNIGSIILGSNLYLTVTLYPETYACTFTLTPTVTECAAGTIAEFDTYDTPTCWPLNVLTLVNGSATIYPTLANSNDYVYYRVDVPQGTTSIQYTGNVTVTTTSSTPYFYIQYGFTPGYSGSFDTLSSTYYSIPSGGYGYLFDDATYPVIAGSVYIALSDAPVDGGWFTITLNSCPAGFAGLDCASPVTIVDINTPLNQAVNLTNVGSYATEYFVIPTTLPSLSFFNFSATIESASANGDLYVYYGKNSFPDHNLYDDEDYTSTVGNSLNFGLTPADFVIPGNFVFGLQNYGTSTASDVQVTVTSAGSSATTGAATGDATGEATGAATDASTTGSASSVAYCFALIALCIAALF